METSFNINEVARNMEESSRAALQLRRDRHEIMTYVVGDWVVREYPGNRIERLCPLQEFRADDYPEPRQIK